MSLTEAKVLTLQEKAKAIRKSVVEMLMHAGSGHLAGSLDMADIFAYLYFYSLKHDPKNPHWEYRDRIVLSNGHIAPVLYSSLAHAGYFDVDQLKTLRKFGSKLQGHPDRNFLDILETSSGPLGSGLSQALGMALADRLDFAKTSGKKFFCLMSDGELDEGNTWEAIMLAGKEKISSLIAIVDRNNIQISGNTDTVMPLEPLANKWRAFNWQVIEIDGHNFVEIDRAIETAKMDSGKPTVIIAKTISTKGIPEFEGKFEWHGKAPTTKEEIEIVSKAFGTDVTHPENTEVRLMSTPLYSMRQAYGDALVYLANSNKNIVALSADLSDSVGLGEFKKKFPERYFEMGVAEQNLVTVASGLAREGKIVFASSYGIFSPGRNWEQIRTTICYNNVPVKIVSTHAGLNVGADGGSHQALEDIALMRVLPNMVVISPCDAIETKKVILAISKNNLPTYVRLPREKSPVITSEDSEFVIGKANIIFESEGKGKSVAIIGTGPILGNALNAAKQLAANGVSICLLNVHTIKPLDRDAIVKIAHKYGGIVVVEEHQVGGGLGGVVAECLSTNFPCPIEFVGVKDRFGQSGKPEELYDYYGLNEKTIAQSVEKIFLRK